MVTVDDYFLPFLFGRDNVLLICLSLLYIGLNSTIETSGNETCYVTEVGILVLLLNFILFLLYSGKSYMVIFHCWYL